jgi:hypothetical protein
MLIPNGSIERLAEQTSLPGAWVREWAMGQGRHEMSVAQPAEITKRVSLIEIYLQKVNLDALPGRVAASA